MEIRLLPVSMAVLLAGCTAVPAPVDNRPTADAYRPAPVTGYNPEPIGQGYHEVQRGDTLYSIAWRYGLDYRDIARWNDIPPPYLIHAGRRLRLLPPAGTAPAAPVSGSARAPAAPASGATRTAPRPPPLIVTTVTGPEQAAPPAREPARPQPPAGAGGRIAWRWPTEGRLIRASGPIAEKGLDIAGREGQPVTAAADGVVVYSGSGLLGYGRLIIIKHDDTYLSAYAHNQIMHVKEGDRVKAGQTIGAMGRGNSGEPQLHFEIRKDGRPVNPLQYLPARS